MTSNAAARLADDGQQAPDLTCICCDRRAFRRFRSVRGYRLYRCDGCGFVTVHPLPRQEDLRRFYNETRVGEESRRSARSPETPKSAIV